MVSYIEGILKIANLFLVLVAGGIALSVFYHAWKNRELRAFGIYESLFLTHVNVSLLLAFLAYALILQIGVVKGYK